jgi:hypothetical protein
MTDPNIESTPLRAQTIAEAVAERREGPKREISAEDAFRLAREERERRALEGDAVAAASEGLPPPMLEGDAFDNVATEFGEGEVPPANNDWMKAAVPDGMEMPKGWTVFIIRFRAEMTNTPGKGDRTCVVWNLSEMDEKLAARRAQGNGLRLIEEMAKGMIRAFDGKKVRWLDPKDKEAKGHDVGQFWTEIGGKCRHQLKSLYLKNHTMTETENTDFFVNCIAPRTAG